MLNSIKEFFEARALTQGDGDESRVTSQELAAAVLMVEISMADSSLDEDEREVIETAMRDFFHLNEEDTKSIISLAEKEVDHAISLHDFTRLLHETMSNEDKIKIIELLWHVAYADAVLDKYEEYYIRKIADLLYVSHRDYIKAKHRAAEIKDG